MSTVEIQIAERARKFRDEALTNLHQFINEPLLEESFDSLNKKGASGVDRESWYAYNEQRSERIVRLYSAFKSGKYRAPNIRRGYIPKDDGGRRPLGIPTVEDKLLQTAVMRVLTPVYENISTTLRLGSDRANLSIKRWRCSLRKLVLAGSCTSDSYRRDADMKNYFGSINHQNLRNFLDLRIKDGVIRKMIDKWLKAGILEEGQLSYPTEGTPQGGSISPLLSNIYLHYILDEWFIEQIQPLLKGKSFIIRYADDFLLGFTNREDAERAMEVLPKRLGKYSLSLNREKTKLIELTKEGSQNSATFDFLGFTHYMGKSRKGKSILKRRTSSKKHRASLKRLNEWVRKNRHKDAGYLVMKLNQKLRGHYGYYGITFNYRRINAYYEAVRRILHYWLNRRGGKRKWIWEKYVMLITKWKPLIKPVIYHSYLLAKP